MTRSLTALLACLCSVAMAAPLTIATGGQSDYAIYVPADAPASVRAAAKDLRRYLADATGATLPIVDAPQEPMIALGASPAATASGVNLDSVPLEGYRLKTAGRNLFILGPDLDPTPQGGSSAGTRNGVSTFLERYVNVRWLCPGPDGDDVPQVETLTVPEMDTLEAPCFLNRRLPYTQQGRGDVKEWWARQKLGYSLLLSHGHNWERPIPASLFESHPDWFAMRGGKRVPPSGRYKLCVTNEAMMDAFAEAAIAYFSEDETRTCFSLSPADSAGWCECSECSKLYETDPRGQLSVTPAILHFYNGVAKRVGKVYPDKVLAGYVYAAYVFPPHNPIRLEPNVYLVWAPSFDYGYTLFRPDLQDQWTALLAQWRQVTDRLAYYDLPIHAQTESGAPSAPGLKILSFLYPRLKSAGITGVYVYGIEAWGRANATNYLLAKLAWDPEADVEALFDEFCRRAYHEGGDEIAQLLRLLDDETETYFVTHPDARYQLTADMIQTIYVPHLADIERLYEQAESQITDRKAKARLAMLGDNLKLFWYTLRQFKLASGTEDSPFYLPDTELVKFLTDQRDGLALQPRDDAGSGRKLPRLVTGAAPRPANAGDLPPFVLRGDQHLVLQPDGAGEVVIQFARVTARGKLVSYSVTGPEGETVESGLVSADVPIRLDPAGAPVYHLFIAAGGASYGLSIEHAAWAADASAGKGLHFLGHPAPVYFEVPAGTASFTLDLESDAPGETAAGILYDPSGREVARFDSSALGVDRKTIQPAPAGWWKLVITEAATGVLDDVYVRVGAPVSTWYGLDPSHLLSVRQP